MKFKNFFTLILLACFIAMLSSLKSQTRDYIPMLNQGAVWFETYSNYIWPPSPYGYSYCGRKYLDGDTIINDNMYSKIYHEKLDIYCTDVIVSGPEYYGAIREDIPEQKVWYFPPNSPFEYLYFDFSLSIGDTVSWWESWFNQGPYTYLTVSDIDTITTFDGVERKRWLFDEDLYSEESSMIEGIGCSSGLLAPYETLFEFANYLANYHIDTTLIYCSDFIGCTLPTDTCISVGLVPSKNDLRGTIFPNPVLVNKPFRVSGIPIINNELYSAELYDAKGIKLEYFNLHNTQLIINAPGKPGIYFLVIFTSTSKKQFKICVQ